MFRNKASLEGVVDALKRGDTENALELLRQFELMFSNSPDSADDETISKLSRIATLAIAAGEGIADARTILEQAIKEAHHVSMYDGSGIATSTNVARSVLGRF